MNKEIKEILDSFKRNYDALGTCYYPEDILGPKDLKPLYDYITNLQEDIGNYVKITLHDRKEIDRLQQENAELKQILHNITINGVEEENTTVLDLIEENKKLREYKKNATRKHWQQKCAEHHVQEKIYKSRCEGTINLIDRTIEIIKQQPTKDDSWILSRLYGFKYALNGSDEE